MSDNNAPDLRIRAIRCRSCGENRPRSSLCRLSTPSLRSAVMTVAILQPICTATSCRIKPQEPHNLLDAAAIVLRENRRQPMTSLQIVEAVIQQELWMPKGATPWLTLHTALSREIESKGRAVRIFLVFTNCSSVVPDGIPRRAFLQITRSKSKHLTPAVVAKSSFRIRS